MKNKLLFLIIFCLATNFTFAQVNLAKWTFPSGTAGHPDSATTANLSALITAEGGASAIDYTTNGAATKCAQATNWDNGANTKFWQILVSTNGYKNIKLSSKQRSGGANPGPRDFKAQYKIASAGSWTDITGTDMNVMNDWTAELNNVALPLECSDQDSLYVRWITTTDTTSTGVIIVSSGISKIDDICVSGELISEINENFPVTMQTTIFPNPCRENFLTLNTTADVRTLTIYDIQGKGIYTNANLKESVKINVSGFKKGMYILRCIYKNNSSSYSKFIIE